MKLNTFSMAIGKLWLPKKTILVMKLTTFIILIVFLQCSAKVYSQKINLNESNAPLKNVFKSIGDQSGYVFFYDSEVVGSKSITVKIKEASLDEAIKECLRNLPLNYEIIDHTVVIKENSMLPPRDLSPMATEIIIKGQVVDSKSLPLRDISVKIENINRGTVTDGNGKFEIKANRNDILVFSSIGYLTKKVTIKDEKEVLNVILEDDIKGLDQVVVLGYGEQKKASVVGAITSVGTTELKQSPVSNLSSALAGRLPGLITRQTNGNLGSDAPALYIRGVATLNGAGPLIVVDGVQGRTISDIDPGDVANVSILKDATATAVYGMRGANGVVLVTTRRGSANKKPEISITSQTGFQSPTVLPKVLNSYQYAMLYNQALVNNGAPPQYSQVALDAYKNHTDPFLYPDNNFASLLLKNRSAISRTNLNIVGGSNFARFFVSAGFLNQEGIYKHFSTPYPSDQVLNQYNFRGNVDIDATKTTLIKLDLSGSFGSINNPALGNQPFFAIQRFAPNLAPIKNPDGSWGESTILPSNPVAELSDVGYSINYTGRSQGSFGLTQQLSFVTKGLSAGASISYDANYSQTQTRSKSFDAFQFGVHNGDTTYVKTSTASKLSPVNANYTLNRFSIYQINLAYQNTFAINHSVSGTVIYSQQKNFNNADIPNALQGLSGRATYSYKAKYLTEFDFGYNGSENFAPGKRFGFFPALAVGWVASEEPFFKENLSAISYLKLRGSYGIVGNDQLNASRFLFQSYYNNAGGTTVGNPPNGSQGSGLAEGFLGNPNVTWEKGYKTNLGIDARFFDNILFFTLDLFNEDRKDILVNSIPPTFAGFPNGVPINKGRVNNKGFELESGINTHIGKNLRISLKGNFNFNKSNVLENNQPTPKYAYLSAKGHPVGQYFGSTSLGFFNSAGDIANSPRQTYTSYIIPGDIKYKDINGDGVIDDFDQTAIGYSYIPQITYGGTVAIRYKGLDVSALFQGTAHSSVYFTQWGAVPFYQSGNALISALDSWTPATAATATQPRIDISTNPNNSRLSTFSLQSGDYLRLKNAEIGFTFSERLIRKIGVTNIRIFVNGQNLITWSRIKFVDPEYPSGSLGTVYPQQKVYNFGLSLNF